MVSYTRVGGFPSRTMAELAVTYLNANGIDAMVSADDAGGTYPHVALLSGGIALRVRAEDAEAARELLAEAEGQPGDGPVERAINDPVRPNTKWMLRWLAAVTAAVIAYVELSATTRTRRPFR